MKLKVDDDFKNLLPELTSEQYTDLEKSIIKYGVLNPIIVWDETIIDGHNRYAICLAHHIQNFPTKEMSFDSKAGAMQWIVDNQFARRNLTLSEKIILQAKVHAELEKEAKGNSGTRTDLRVNLPQGSGGRVSERMAEKVGVSEKTYRDAKFVVEHGTQEQIDRMDKKVKIKGKSNGASAIANEIRNKDVPVGMKKCKKCGQILPRKNFYIDRAVCKECFNKPSATYDFNGDIIQVPSQYKDVSDQSIIDGLYTDDIGDMTIEDVVNEFFTNFRHYMNSLVSVLKEHSDVIGENKEAISKMWATANDEFQNIRKEYE